MQLAVPGKANVPRVMGRLVRLRSTEAWLLILFCVDVVALGDVATGPELWFGPIYLLVICLAAWTLGWRAGQTTGIGCMLLTFAINGVTLYPHGPTALPWNFAMRFVAISILIAVIAGARRTYVREWWLARTDPLTGALNRQAFFELASSAVGTRQWRVLLYADLDGLKKLNDRRGHAAGDASLKVFATEVRRAIRRSDIFARVGGDEFLVFMQVKDEAAGRSVAARLHRQMNGIPAINGGLQCSVGGLVVAPGGGSIDDLVSRADHLMYEAKLRGADLELALASNTAEPLVPGRARHRPRQSVISLRGKPLADRRAIIEAGALERLPR
jgi:diguanylate cyclase (GGDEF)-like protein